MMNIEDLARLLERYRNGQCSPGEERLIEEWYASLQLKPPPIAEPDVDASLEKVFERLDSKVRRPATILRRSYRRLLVAAAVVLLSVGFFWVYRNGQSQRPGLAVTDRDSITISTVSGEIKKMVLGDGSVVQLNANSIIRYPRQFNGGTRGVSLLEGEAFFQVATGPAHPFIVITEGVKTVVLGTSFNIRSYGRDKKVAIALVSGKIQVSTPSDTASVTLAPHDLLEYEKGSGKLDRLRFDNETAVAAWKQRAMNFKDASFEDVAFEVNNMYNITVVNQSNKRHWSYTGYFNNEGIWEIINTICITENLTYKFDQGHIILINKN